MSVSPLCFEKDDNSEFYQNKNISRIKIEITSQKIFLLKISKNRNTEVFSHKSITQNTIDFTPLSSSDLVCSRLVNHERENGEGAYQ